MKLKIIDVVTAAVILATPAGAQMNSAIDPAAGLDRPFGLGGRTCKQYDDTGRLYLYTEGMPSHSVLSWLQQSDGGTKAAVAMPEELVVALPRIPGCMPGKHHADLSTADPDPSAPARMTYTSPPGHPLFW